MKDVSQVCNTCKVEKPISEYYFRKDKNAHRKECKVCRRKQGNSYSEKNREKKRLYAQQWRKNNPNYEKDLCGRNPDRLKKKAQHLRDDRKKNPEKYLNYDRARTQNPKRKVWRTEYNYSYKIKRKMTDPLFAEILKIGSSVRRAFSENGYEKGTKTCEILGIDYAGLMRYFESKFLDGMSWDNRDRWHIDHIVPLATAETYKDLIRLNHYTNLQPLWAEINLWKADSTDFDLQAALEYWYAEYGRRYKLSA